MHTEDAVRMCGVLYQQSSGKGEFNPTSWQRSSIAKDRLRSLGVDARITSARLQFNPAPEGVHAFIRLGDQRSLAGIRSEEHTSELQSLMRISYAVVCLKKKKHKKV